MAAASARVAARVCNRLRRSSMLGCVLAGPRVLVPAAGAQHNPHHRPALRPVRASARSWPPESPSLPSGIDLAGFSHARNSDLCNVEHDREKQSRPWHRDRRKTQQQRHDRCEGKHHDRIVERDLACEIPGGVSVMRKSSPSARLISRWIASAFSASMRASRVPTSSASAPSVSLRSRLASGSSLVVTQPLSRLRHAPVASGWSGCRVGLAPTGKRRLVTAHTHSGRSASRAHRRRCANAHNRTFTADEAGGAKT
jgi:hypothetical protein